MENQIYNRLTSLRALMRDSNIHAVIIPSSDPHMSEYLATHWKVREWFSGFTGSAGTLVVTLAEAGLWTDSRYFIQATRELKDTGITLYKDGLSQTPSVAEFLQSQLSQGDTISIYGEIISVQAHSQWQEQLSNFKINTEDDLFTLIWKDRPELPNSPCYTYDIKYSGESVESKLNRIREVLPQNTAILVSALDEIAWTLNIRGNEIQNNPVVISYLLIDKNSCSLFIDSSKINAEVEKHLSDNHISLAPYSGIFEALAELKIENLQFDPQTTNAKAELAINPKINKKPRTSPIPLFKAIRNEVEIKNLKSAMTKDGVALVRFLIWLEENIESQKITEIDVSDKLYELRAKQSLFKGESFDTIAGYKEHGAIVHYKATPQTNATLKPKGFLLVDSGAQYLDGTTDITRTIALGELSDQEKEDYTAVLKGNINLARAIFPEGTRGSQLDILARLPLWEMKKNFLHGTGHGVGHFMCVHEGPQSIRMNENSTTMHLGMLTSNEPGVYIENSHGIRIENLLLVAPMGEGLFTEYYQFNTVTLCPICTKGVLKDRLSPEEISWLNAYHENVYINLAPHLTNKEQEWLKQATAKI